MPTQPPRFSAAAIAGFVLSLLGCLGITAVLGLIFGVVGIITTRGGARRGLGLAIASIPISLLTGALFAASVAAIFAFGHVMAAVMMLPNLYDADGNIVPETMAVFRAACTDEFRADVSEQQLAEWFSKMRAEHGALVELKKGAPPERVPGTNKAKVHTTGKFINGEQDIVITLQTSSMGRVAIDDFEIAGSSPRSPD